MMWKLWGRCDEDRAMEDLMSNYTLDTDGYADLPVLLEKLHEYTMRPGDEFRHSDGMVIPVEMLGVDIDDWSS